MSRQHDNLTSLFQDIADAIYLKNGYDEATDSEGQFIADNFPTAISTIDTDPSGDATINNNNQLLSGVTAYGQGHKYTGTIVTQNDSGTTTLDQTTQSVSYAAGYYPNTHGADISLESEQVVNPTESSQTIQPFNGKLLSTVTVNAISSTYVGSDIPQNDANDVTVSGATVTIPDGYYSDDVIKSVATTNHPDPIIDTSYNNANHKLQITASHTQGTGYVIGSTTTDSINIDGGEVSKSGDTVTTSAGYYNADVTTTVDSATQATPTISGTVDSEGNLIITSSTTQTAGWVSAGTKSASYQVNAGSISTSGATVTTGAGYYDDDVGTTIASGSATTPTDSITSNPTISWNSTSKKIEASHSGSKSITPTVSAGYVSEGTAGTISTSGSTDITAESLDSHLVASNVKSGVTIFNTTGTYTSDANATAENILYNKTAYVNGNKITGSMANNGSTGGTITTQGGTYTIPSGYTSGGTVTANIPVDTLDNSIIDGAAFEEASGDFGWQSTVQIPAGMHAGQTLTKTFSDVFPAPASEGTSDDILAGQQFYNHSGQLITGTMTNNGADSHTISTQGGTYTIPEGYHNGSGVITASIGAVSGSIGGTASAGSASAAITNTDSMRTVASPSGTAGTDYFRVKATATGNAGSYTPKYTVNTAGYISSNITGTAQSVSVNGDSTGQTINIPKATFTIDGQSVKTSSTGGGYVKDSTTVGTVSAGTIATPSGKSATATISGALSPSYNSTNGNFDVTGSASNTVSVTPIVSTAGYVSSSVGTKTAANVTANASLAGTLSKISGSVSISGTKLYTPSISRTAKPSGDTWVDAASGAATTTKPTSGPYVQVGSVKNSGNVNASATISTAGYGTSSAHGISGSGNVEVGANASAATYIPITTTSASVDGATVSYGSGWITAGSKTVASGSATTPATSVSPGSGSGSINSSTGVVTITSAQNTKSVTPTVSAGYITSGTAGTITVPQTSFTYQLPTTKAAATITPGTTNQTIAAGTYLTGTQTISGDSDLVAANIKKGVQIFSVTGTYTSDATATTSDIKSGKTAYVNGSKITGSATLATGDCIVIPTETGKAGMGLLNGKGSVSGEALTLTAGSVSGENLTLADAA